MFLLLCNNIQIFVIRMYGKVHQAQLTHQGVNWFNSKLRPSHSKDKAWTDYINCI